jgi:hypothetical protein
METRRGALLFSTRAGLRTVAAAILPGLRPVLCAVVARGRLALARIANAAQAVRGVQTSLTVLAGADTLAAPAVNARFAVVLYTV